MRQLLLIPVACAVALSVAPPCDVEHKSGDEVCADFCNYKCGFYNTSEGETGEPMNMTVYRITPHNVTGLLNKNTGDAPGDVTFVLTKKNQTQYCLHNPGGMGCHTDVEGQDFYGTFVVEVDGQWGPYQMCNPADGWDTADWRCGLQCMKPTHAAGCPRTPTSPYDRNGTGFMGYQCWCDRTYKTAGREKSPGSHHSGASDWPPQCSTGTFYPPQTSGSCATGAQYKLLQGWSAASALTMACKECADDKVCTGWRLGQDGKSAELFQGEISYENCTSGQHSAYKHSDSHHHGGGSSWYGVGDLGGFWYSLTTGGGECKDGAPLGTDGCNWRVVETKAYKNATCVDSLADAAVEAYGKACFDMCPQPLNRMTDCYLDCYRNVLLGDASLNITKPPSKLLVDPWVRAIHEDDPSKGGCPPVKPFFAADPLSAPFVI